MRVKDVLVILFVGGFYYGILPMMILWTGFLVWFLATYSVKTLLYMTTGTPSIIGATGPAAIAPAFAESALGLLLSLLVLGTWLLYRYLRLHYRYVYKEGLRQDQIPLSDMIPSSAADNPDT